MDGTTDKTKFARVEGTVKAFDTARRHGFIGCKDGSDIFVHVDSVEGEGAKTITSGDRVEFAIEKGLRGPKAAAVRVL